MNDICGQVWFTECGHDDQKIPVEFHAKVSQQDGDAVVKWLANFGQIFDYPMSASVKNGYMTVNCYDFQRDKAFKKGYPMSLIKAIVARMG